MSDPNDCRECQQYPCICDFSGVVEEMRAMHEAMSDYALSMVHSRMPNVGATEPPRQPAMPTFSPDDPSGAASQEGRA